MRRQWLTVLGCVCILASPSCPMVVPTQDTMVVARSDDGASSTSTPAVPSTDGTTEEPVPPIKLTDMDVTSTIALRYASTAVVTNIRNPASRAQEATFRVLLPETAFISGFTMTLDGKSYKAYVKEKEEAKQIYNQAVSQGLGAAHVAVKARDSSQFEVTTNVEPNSVAIFNLTYEELLVRRNGVYNLAINLHPGSLVPKLTVTVNIKESQKITTLRVPEVRTGNEIDATEEDAQNTKAVVERGNNDREAKVVFKPDLQEQERLIEIYRQKSKESRSTSHSYSYGYDPYEDGDKKEVDGVLGQFVVQYDVERPKDGEILVNDGYFVHFFAPSNLPPLAKHVVFVLDTSGSMMARKIVQLREAMQTILSELNQGDYFNIVEFASTVKVYEMSEADKPALPQNNDYFSYYNYNVKTTLKPPAQATPENIEKAKIIVSRLNASGGTNIYSALDVAIDLIKKGIGWTPEEPSNQTTTEVLHEASSAAILNPIPSAAVSSDASPTPSAVVSTDASPTTTPAKPATTAAADTTAAAATSPNTAPASSSSEVAEGPDSSKLEPIIIFLTDGDPTVGETDPTRITNHLTEKNTGFNKATIFSLAFGEDADRKFLRKLSLKNDGFMRHIYEASDAALQLRDFYRQVSSPLLADVKFIYPKKQVKEGSVTKHHFRRYYDGSETVVAGELESASSELTPQVFAFCGVQDGPGRKRLEIIPIAPEPAKRDKFLPLERLWAHLTVKQLLDERDASDTRHDEKPKEDSPEKKALAIALKYEFVTPLTSLVVVKPNATDNVNAESVDKQNDAGPSGGAVMAQFLPGLPGVPGQPSPSYAFSAPLPYPPSAGFGAPAPLGTSSLFSASADAFAPMEEEEKVEFDDVPNTETGNSRFPVYAYAAKGGTPQHLRVDTPIANWAPTWPSTTISVVSTSPKPDVLMAYHLEDYSWIKPLLDSNDAVILQVNSSTVTLHLAKNEAPKTADVSDPECLAATDGAPGVCVYLTRCDAARSLTAQAYSNAYCVVSNLSSPHSYEYEEYAGVCCPKTSVDVVKST